MSVRDKYRLTVNELQRAESIPERISIFRRAWEWIIIPSHKVVASFVTTLVSLYLMELAWRNFDECGEIPTYLLFIGLGIFVCGLYTPFYVYGKKKALQDRQERINNDLEPIHEGEILPEEVNKFIPCYMNRISYFAYLSLMGTCPGTTYYTFHMFSSRDECDSLTYWTAFVICTIYSLWVITLLAACLLCCCYLMIPRCIEKLNRNNREEIEAV